jgi:hypothetical protein
VAIPVESLPPEKKAGIPDPFCAVSRFVAENAWAVWFAIRNKHF